MDSGIYKITSPSGRIYIGQSINIPRRKRGYARHDAKKQPKLSKSLLKYGFENHVFEILELCEINLLNTRERYWQDFYDACSPKNLNLTLTGPNGNSGKLSDSTRAKMSKNRKGVPHSDKWRENISISQRGENGPRYGIVGKDHPNAVPVIQMDMDGNVITEHESLNLAAISVGTDNARTKICAVCRGKYGRKSAYGFRWSYKPVEQNNDN